MTALEALNVAAQKAYEDTTFFDIIELGDGEFETEEIEASEDVFMTAYVDGAEWALQTYAPFSVRLQSAQETLKRLAGEDPEARAEALAAWRVTEADLEDAA